MVRLTSAMARVALPVLCLLAGGAGGWLLRGAPAPAVPRPREVRAGEGGYRFVNPLVACELGPELIQSEELRPFRAKVEASLRGAVQGEDVLAVSVYFHELNDGIWFVLGERQAYTPASLRKVPLLVAMLKQAERDPSLLSRKVPARLERDYAQDQTVKPSQTLVPGTEYAVGELLRRMIVYSDNNAFMLLAGIVDERQLDRAYDLTALGRATDGEQAEFGSILTYASLFRILYNASYLGKDLSEQALGLLAQSEFRSGIVAGVPPGLPVAHKFGEHRDERNGEVQLHDCGIVYFPRHPYVLCVMTRGRSLEPLGEAIAATSRLVHAEVDAQFRAAR